MAHHRIVLACVTMFGASMTPWAAAAQGTSRFHGTVVDAATMAPLAGVRIVVHSRGDAAVVTDSAGRFDVRGLPHGVLRFTVAARGFPRSNLVLAFAAGETIERTLELDSSRVVTDSTGVRALTPVTVDATATPARYADFERRRRSGRGQYLTRTDLEKGGFNRLSDAVQTMRGVLVECGGGGGCYIRMARAPRGCLPEYFVDDQHNEVFGLQTPIRDIEGIEVYLGASDVPGEFAGRNAGCGVIVIWTKSGPSRP